MPRYLVRCENNPVGEVTAADERAAVDAAYKLRDWTPRDAMSLLKLPESTIMHILIDTTNGRALARHESYRALAALHFIQFANVDGAILRCGENKVWSQFSHEQLESLLRYAGYGHTVKMEYSKLITTVRGVLEDAEWLLLPFTVAQLEKQALAIGMNDDRPMAFDPNNTAPALVQRWSSEPQINRKRGDSSFWVNFAAGDGTGQSNASALPADAPSGRVRGRNSPPISSNEETMASTKAAKKAATKKVVKKTAPAKKAAAKKTAAPAAKKPAANGAQEERNGIKRPKPGGNTAQVWDACDALYAKGKVPSFKEVDEYIEKKNDQIPTATRRSNYAVWRKFNGITGRVG